jgi:dTDP-4-amino-4,6-dideoxygalactose transaminase
VQVQAQAASGYIPFFKYPEVFRAQEEEFLRIVREIGNRGAFILQSELESFEKNLAQFVGAKYALGVANATDGLLMAVRACGIGPGDEVILSSHTMIATAAAVHFAGAKPIPVECGPDHLIDVHSVEAAITPATRAIMPTQLNGRTSNMDALQAIAKKYGLLIIEDAAQALGSKFKGKSAGTFGSVSAISFYPAKVLGCFGDGGAVLTDDDNLYEQMFQMRDHGRNRHGQIVSWGLNSRLDNLQAAILDFQLKSFSHVVERRRQVAAIYDTRMKELAELILPPAPGSDPDHFDIFQNYEIEADERDGLRQYLAQHGVGTLIQWGGQAVHQLKALGFQSKLPFTDLVFRRTLMLPMNMSLSDDDVEYVCDRVKEYYRK